jgi:dipeptidyl aminopeptidase/acylaminoacyl peptidase
MRQVVLCIGLLLLLSNLYTLFALRVPEPAQPDLLAAREGHQTVLLPLKFPPDEPAPEPPPEIYRKVTYPGPLGPMVAYLTPDPADNKKRPAIIWAHGGFGGVREYTWSLDNDQSPRAFLHHDFVLMCPSWRAENENPGRFELFYGELHDLLAAIDFLRQQPHVDPQRIYLVGYSIGGTLSILAAQATDKIRAVISIGGGTDVARILSDGKGYGNTPFDWRNSREVALRDPMNFVQSIRVPIFYFEGGDSWYARDGCRMQELAKAAGKPFQALIVPLAHHWNILQPACKVVADKIRQDTGPECSLQFTTTEIRAVYDSMSQPHQDQSWEQK